MIWLKAFHIVFVVTWFAGLFYLPRLFVYHAATEDAPGLERFQIMERKLFAIMSIGGGLATITGLWLLGSRWLSALPATGWLQAKLVLVAALIGYHVWCWRIVGDFRAARNRRSARWFRWFNEAPALLLVAIVTLAVVKPF